MPSTLVTEDSLPNIRIGNMNEAYPVLTVKLTCRHVFNRK